MVNWRPLGTVWHSLEGPGIHGILIQKHLVDTFTRYVSKDDLGQWGFIHEMYIKKPLYTYWNQVYPYGQFAIRGTVGRCSKHQICLTVGSRIFGFEDSMSASTSGIQKNMMTKSIHKHFVICRHTTLGFFHTSKLQTKRLRISVGFWSKEAAYCWDPIQMQAS